MASSLHSVAADAPAIPPAFCSTYLLSLCLCVAAAPQIPPLVAPKVRTLKQLRIRHRSNPPPPPPPPSAPPLLPRHQRQGHDASTHVLATFGGAGPQHCCAMARALGMSRILVSRFSGVLSAYGLSAADVVCEKQEACAAEYGEKGGEGPPEVCLFGCRWCVCTCVLGGGGSSAGPCSTRLACKNVGSSLKEGFHVTMGRWLEGG